MPRIGPTLAMPFMDCEKAGRPTIICIPGDKSQLNSASTWDLDMNHITFVQVLLEITLTDEFDPEGRLF